MEADKRAELLTPNHLAQVCVGCQKDAYFYIDVDVCILHISTHPNKRAELLTPNQLAQVGACKVSV